MSPKIASNIRLDPELLDGMRSVREAVGIPVSEQVRRAVTEWLHRMLPEAARHVQAQAVRDIARTDPVLARAARVAGGLATKASKTKTARKRAVTR